MLGLISIVYKNSHATLVNGVVMILNSFMLKINGGRATMLMYQHHGQNLIPTSFVFRRSSWISAFPLLSLHLQTENTTLHEEFVFIRHATDA